MPVVTTLPAAMFRMGPNGRLATAATARLGQAFGAEIEVASYNADPGHDRGMTPGDAIGFADGNGDPVGPAGTFRGTATFAPADIPTLRIPLPQAPPVFELRLTIPPVQGQVVEGFDGQMYLAGRQRISGGRMGITAHLRAEGRTLADVGTTLRDLATDIGAVIPLNDTLNDAMQRFAQTVRDTATVSVMHDTAGTFTPPKGSLLCFVAGTPVQTATGPAAAETLTAGDRIATMDHGLQPIRWAGTIQVTAPMLQAMPNLRPVRIRAGALGRGMPTADLLVSPQYRVTVAPDIARRMFAASDVRIAAKHLIGLAGIGLATEVTEVTYCHLLCDECDIVPAHAAESGAHPPGTTRHSASAAARQEILSLFPHLAPDPPRAHRRYA
ncbi:Hint domain-containing protein [Falsirhodobacter halotolerans]|uniref:Hint domain-containing protein n=1 Tax=Falsirhodobacter halotolerans TaxID=1146892 RepID=UPI001FD4E601|nr:Hint domain-containing protein [Falsirhodobacter halotolerans]MCJ8140405.1 Hint domain-containing protein [Falsirhodobacter halotolerans]